VPTYAAIIGNAHVNNACAALAGKGHYNDADMLEIGNGKLALSLVPITSLLASSCQCAVSWKTADAEDC
jgi:hypothetical protein